MVCTAMDMMFRDDEWRIRAGHAPANVNALRHRTNNLYRKSSIQDSMRLTRKTAAWHDEYLPSLIAA